MEQRGFILIADITGYTAYLNESELEHAQGTLTELIELLIDHTRRPLVVSRLEGDAVISYGLEDGFLTGQTFLETIESTYVAFRKAIELMVINNTCECNACANVAALDLKFFVHFGTFVLQTIGDHQELLGPDVNLIHRLLKNSVTEETGVRAYLLCTRAAADALALDPEGVGLVRHTERVADFGDTTVWVGDMGPIYERRKDEQVIDFDAKEVLGSLTVDIALPPSVVWDYMSAPEFRRVLNGSDRQEIIDRQAGRVAEGSGYLCYHGKAVVTQAVLEWRPFERLVVHQPLGSGDTSMVVAYELQPTETGTRLVSTAARPSGSGLRGKFVRLSVGLMVPRARRNLAAFRDLIEADHASRHPDAPPPDVAAGSASDAAAVAVRGWSSPPAD